ncbi:hypothetical protein BDZ89DRAFT_280312 [Hymenopellis radicata]|nr:hypothetical protein BDZ89DRAFT_280312 [Hymenopellis radicata]
MGSDNLNLKGWISAIEYMQWIHAVVGTRETCLEALAVLAETVGGVARGLWRGVQRDGSDGFVSICYAAMSCPWSLICTRRSTIPGHCKQCSLSPAQELGLTPTGGASTTFTFLVKGTSCLPQVRLTKGFSLIFHQADHGRILRTSCRLPYRTSGR